MQVRDTEDVACAVLDRFARCLEVRTVLWEGYMAMLWLGARGMCVKLLGGERER